MSFRNFIGEGDYLGTYLKNSEGGCNIWIMIVEIAPPCPLERFGEEKITYQLSSVGVWVIVSKKGRPRFFMAVQQADKPGYPWGIPAGKVSGVDQDFQDVGIREVREETGLALDRDELEYLHWGWERYDAKKGYLIYTATINQSRVRGDRVRNLKDGTILYNPPTDVNSREVKSLALIPLSLAFCSNVLTRHPYHPAETYRGLAALRYAGLVSGSFSFEEDPGL